MTHVSSDFSLTENFAIRGGFQVEPIVITSGNPTLHRHDFIVIIKKTTGSATTVTLPTQGSSQRLTIKDGKGDAGTNNITIVGTGNTIDGAANVVLSSNYASVDLFFNGSEWSVI